MMNLKRVAALIAVMTACCISVSAQQQKIGIINLKTVFDGYYKTKQADAQLKERAGEAEKVMKGMREDFEKARDEYRKLIEGSNDQAVSAEEREKRKKGAEGKLSELQEIEKSVVQFERQTRASLEEQKRRMRDTILDKIRELVNARAKTAGYTHVIDTAAESINQTPVLFYHSGQNDLTQEILTAMNADAPAGNLDAPAGTAKETNSAVKPLPDVFSK
ncbi:MAG: OmpH family outer membrane protein [Verrucomicrobiota bacterium]|nr:OmpH family outer membrane protein [Verrucomicrobiota bacterium]